MPRRTPTRMPSPRLSSPLSAADADRLRPSASHHRRIALQSPADLSYLLHASRRAARRKIDLHLPLAETNLPVRNHKNSTDKDGEEGDLRRGVEREVDSFLSRVFENIAPNVEINGLSPALREEEEEGGEGEYEPFDAKLAEQVSGIHARIEGLNLDLARLRREAAVTGAKEFQEGFEKSNHDLEGEDQEMQDDEVERLDLELDGETVQGISAVWARAMAEILWLRQVDAVRKDAEDTLVVVGVVEGEVK